MAYPALPDMRIPYDNDGTVVYQAGPSGIADYSEGAGTERSGAQKIALNNFNLAAYQTYNSSQYVKLYFFFVERREITAIATQWARAATPLVTLHGSNDTTNGSDGTWEVASFPGGAPNGYDYSTAPFDFWRSSIKAVSFTGSKKAIRLLQGHNNTGGTPGGTIYHTHLYGERAAGFGSGHDLLFIDEDDTPGTEYATADDFGDRPLATTVVHEFKLKNVSATRAAVNVNVQCNDSDFAIATSSSGPWVVTITIASLAPGATSASLYVRDTTPSPGAALGPRYARIVVTAEDGSSGNFFA